MTNSIGSIIYQMKGEIDNTNLFCNKKGVWALFGSKDNNNYTCLNVGKNVNIGKEVRYDIKCIKSNPQKGEGNLRYINQFAEYCRFNYCCGKTREYLYPYLNREYENGDLVFIFVYDKESDQKYEERFAWLTHSFYWRNGGPFRNEREDYYNKYYSKILGRKESIKKSQTIKEWIKCVKEIYSNN